MIDIVFRINNVDYSHLLSKFNVTIETEYPHTMTAIDGTEYGYAMNRPTVTFSLIPLTDAQTAEFYANIASMNVICEYTDPYRNRTVSSTMRVMTSLESVFGLKSIDGNRYYKGTEITLRQRTVL